MTEIDARPIDSNKVGWKRVTRLTFARIVAAFSVIVSACIAISWVRSYQSDSDQLSWRFCGDRYTVRAQRGKLLLRDPPRPSSTRDFEISTALSRKLSNEDIAWLVTARPDSPKWRNSQFRLSASMPRFIRKDGAFLSDQDEGDVSMVLRLQNSAVAAAFLRALEDPKRLIVADTVLSVKCFNGPGPGDWSQRQNGNKVIRNYNGLEVEFTVPLPQRPEAPEPVHIICRKEPEVYVNPRQFSEVRSRWHDRLDQSILAVPHAGVFLLLLIWPTILFAKHERSVLRVRRGLCSECGYDLRRSGGRCPECGKSQF